MALSKTGPETGSSNARVTVAIASMGRSTLARTLQSVADQDLPDGVTLEVVVADDSKDGTAAALIANESFGIPVGTVAVGSGNIATARNAALERAEGSWIAFIDDDEWAEPNWIADLLGVAVAYGADAVIGPVEALYPEGTPDWMGRVRLGQVGIFQKRPGADGQTLDTGATSNALVRRSAIGDLRFREEFGRTGGEDTDFFRRFHKNGGKIVAASRGLVSEHVPSDRLTSTHLRRRFGRGGHTFARIELEGCSVGQRTMFYLQSALKWMVANALAFAFKPFDPAKSLSYALRAALNGGKLRYALGRAAPRLY